MGGGDEGKEGEPILLDSGIATVGIFKRGGWVMSEERSSSQHVRSTCVVLAVDGPFLFSTGRKFMR